VNTSDDPAVGRGPVIAVIGGGTSGTLATISLLRCAGFDVGVKGSWLADPLGKQVQVRRVPGMQEGWLSRGA
jgi:hypothetical protein